MRGWKGWLLATVGGVIFALAVDLCYLPAQITTGGVTGIAMVLYRLLKVPVGLAALGLNVPLFVLGFLGLGRSFGAASLYGAATAYLACDGLAFLEGSSVAAILRADPLLAALSGGILMGAGLGLVFAAGATTGGMDIAVCLIQKKRPSLSLGWLMLVGDIVIIAAGTAVTGDVRGLLYGCVALFISSRTVDGVLYGLDRGCAALIVTSAAEAVKREIYTALSRGVTVLPAAGGYTGEPRQVLLCAVSRPQTAALTAAVRRADPAAFLILTEAREMVGEGFGRQK